MAFYERVSSIYLFLVMSVAVFKYLFQVITKSSLSSSKMEESLISSISITLAVSNYQSKALVIVLDCYKKV